jgi:hypothetical protein
MLSFVQDDEEELKETVMEDMADIFSKVDKGGDGVCVQVSESCCDGRSHLTGCCDGRSHLTGCCDGRSHLTGTQTAYVGRGEAGGQLLQQKGWQ